jgi:hypothetical protein
VNGADTNPCSDVNTPCRTFGGAVAQVDAGGEVIVLNSGSYGGASIAKSVRIDVPEGVVAFAASPFTIDAGPGDVVVLRGLTLKALTPGTGVGIDFNTGAVLHVERCVIDGWDFGVLFDNPGKLYVSDTVVRNTFDEAVRVGQAFSGVAEASIEHLRIEDSGGPNHCALGVLDGGRASVRDSEVSGNAEGLCVQALAAGTAVLSVKDVLAAHNAGSGILCFSAGATARVAHSIVTDNGTGLNQLSGCTFESLGDNLVRGNTANTAGTITIVAGQ